MLQLPCIGIAERTMGRREAEHFLIRIISRISTFVAYTRETSNFLLNDKFLVFKDL